MPYPIVCFSSKMIFKRKSSNEFDAIKVDSELLRWIIILLFPSSVDLFCAFSRYYFVDVDWFVHVYLFVHELYSAFLVYFLGF